MTAGHSSWLFVVRCACPPDDIRSRVDRLLEFYDPLGVEGAELAHLPTLSLLVGSVRFHDPLAEPMASVKPSWGTHDRASLSWGGPLVVDLDADKLLDAPDRTLRRLDRTLALFSADGPRARLVTGCAGATTLYAARSPDAQAWSSHALAASYLAHGWAELDPTVLPEFFAAEFVGRQRSHLREVETVAAASVFDFTPSGATSRSYWPPRDRYAHLPPSEAIETAATVLVRSLAERADSARDLELGLTAGADSRVAAVALREAGVSFDAITVAGSAEYPDARGAAAVAEALGVPHRVHHYRFVSEEAGLALLNAEARWSEGLAPLSGFGVTEAGAPDLKITGGGGETGRAWYYRWQARNYRNPRRPALARALAHLHWRIEEAAPEAHELVDQAVRSWIDQAYGTGHEGWRALDVVYEEQRLRRWGRARLERSHAPVLYAFSTPDLTRALISMPLEDRITDGFHRAFLDRHAPELGIAAPATQRRGVPRPARRVMSALRQRRGLARSAHGRWFLADLWKERPLTRAYIAEEVLTDETLKTVMGEPWLTSARDGFVAGERHATELALLATGIVTFNRAIQPLSRSAAERSPVTVR